MQQKYLPPPRFLLLILLAVITLWSVNPLAHTPAWAARLLSSPLPTPGTPCASQSAGGYTFDFLGYVNDNDGTTTLFFRVATTNKKEISHIAFGTGSWTPLAPTNNSSVTGSLGAYHAVWTNTNGNPGFPSIKFEPQFSGYSQGKTDAFSFTVTNFTSNTPILIEAKAGTDKVRVTLSLTTPACNRTPTPTPTPKPISPLPTPTARPTLPAFVPTVMAYTIMDTDFTSPLSDTAKQALWQQGLPVPATMVAQNQNTAVNPSVLADISAASVAVIPSDQQITASGWSSLYMENFDVAFPTPGQQGQCQLGLESIPANTAYQWGRDTFRTFNNSAGAAWSARGGTAGARLHPGTDTYPENLTTKIICTFTNLSQAKNMMGEFALWLDRADDGDGFFFGFNTGEKDTQNNLVFRGRLWASTAMNPQNQAQWITNRVFYPEIGSKAAQNGGKVSLMWAFQSDSLHHASAQGAWLDSLNIERYDKPTTSINCQANDHVITETVGTPNNVAVSKGINLPPYVDDTLSGKMKRLKESGVNWVRLELIASPIAFSNINVALTSTSDRYNHLDLKYYDDLIDSLCANQIGVLGLVDNQTLLDQSWKAANAVSDEYKFAFTEITGQLVRYYDDRIRYWEVWNEPDNEDRRLLDTEYPKLLISVYDKIKATDPGDQVLFGGLGGADQTAKQYLIEAYRTLLASHRTNPSPYDIFAIHPYPSVEYFPSKVVTDPAGYMLQSESGAGPTIIHKFTQVMGGGDPDLVSNPGDVDKPIWITELGWNRGNDPNGSADTKACAAINQTLVTGPEQAMDLTIGFDILFKQTAWDWTEPNPKVPSVRKIFWYQYQDTGVSIEVQKCGVVASSNISPSWYDSYTARFANPTASTKLIDWWFGLYSGIDRAHNKTEPDPNLAECTYRRYPDLNAIRSCLGLTKSMFLPLIQNKTIIASGQ